MPDEMLSAAERAASEKMTVLVVEPMKEPYVKEINSDLHSLQAEVGGDIGATYPILTRWHWFAMMKESS